MAKRKRKRAKGGGRPPAGEYAKRTAAFTMRMSAELRKALERESARSGRSLSQEVEHLLRNALDFPKRMQSDWKADHHYGLGRLVARVAWSVEFSTGLYTPNEAQTKTWLADPFTAAAVRVAIDTLLRGMAPPMPAELAVPARVAESAAAHTALARAAEMAGDPLRSGDQTALHMTPEGVGSIAAHSALDQLHAYDYPPRLGRPANTHYADMFYDVPLIREKLGLSR